MQQRAAWTKPEFDEINLSSEIGSYFEEEDPPAFVRPRPAARRVRAYVARRGRRGVHERPERSTP